MATSSPTIKKDKTLAAMSTKGVTNTVTTEGSSCLLAHKVIFLAKTPMVAASAFSRQSQSGLRQGNISLSNSSL